MEKELIFYHKEFEKAVCHELLIKDRPIYLSEATNVIDLELYGFDFDDRDCETLCCFTNLERLYIEIGFEEISFLASFPKLEDLYLEYSRSLFDFKHLSECKSLNLLAVSGGAWSSMSLKNMEFISDIGTLQDLTLHEFGDVDLRPLHKMKQLKNFYCGYADNVYNYDAIASLTNLECLSLIGIKIDNANFLRELPESMFLELCGVEFTEDIDISIFDRFAEKDICEIVINGERVLFEGDKI